MTTLFILVYTMLMLSETPRKTIYIAIAVIILLLSAGYIYFSNTKEKPLLKPLVSTTEISPTPKVTMTDYKDPLGFSLSYPSNFSVNTHPEDQENYADVELSAVDKTQNIKLLVSDTKYSDISTWALNDSTVKEGTNIDSKLGNLDAKKVYLAKSNKIIMGAIWDGMLFTTEITPADNEASLKTVASVLSTLTIPETANYTNGVTSTTTGPADTSGSDDSGDEVVE